MIVSMVDLHMPSHPTQADLKTTLLKNVREYIHSDTKITKNFYENAKRTSAALRDRNALS